jgi:microcystin-dependent protein
MPRNASGTYTLPVAPFTANTTIRSADVNSDFSDIASALTTSLATTGVSSMTGPLKLADGSAAAPSLTLASDATTGWYKSATGTLTYVGSGTAIMTLAPTGATITNLIVTNLTVTGSFSVASARIIGEIIDYGGTAAPSLWLLCYGQAISRTTYSSLFAAISTAFGAGDGVTTFNVPDLRGRTTYGKDDMGGIAANRVTTAGGGIDGLTLGATGGAQNRTIAQANLPVVSLSSASLSASTSLSNGDQVVRGATSASPGGGVNTGSTTSTITASTTISGTVPLGGSGTALATLSPATIVNKMIYAGV